MNKEEFLLETKKINIDITEDIYNKLEEYYKLLISWNEKMNLTGITDHEEVYLKHFYDSLTMNKIIKLDNQSILDIGTGAGFPGLVLKIVFRELKITLLDSLGKRCIFLKEVIKELNLKDVEVINDRAEIYARKNSDKFDIVTSRAVANLRHLLEFSSPTTKVNGFIICYKGKIEEELQDSKNAITTLSLSLEEELKFNLPIIKDNRTLLKFKKLKPTYLIYPRDYKDIKAKPL